MALTERCASVKQRVPEGFWRDKLAFCPLHADGRIVARQRNGTYASHPAGRTALWDETVQDEFGDATVEFAQMMLAARIDGLCD